ncbi:MAG TPA: hypothetical protein VFQ61_31885 [Polyangiaceae bacterium]|nr:hypothetical protein [Polyangiaceae bacterium]
MLRAYGSLILSAMIHAQAILRTIALLGLTLSAGPALAAEPTVRAEMECGAASNVVLCVVKFEPSHAAHITWAEASIVAAPPFTSPVLPKATYRESAIKKAHLRLVLLPKGAGQGTIVVKGRGVVCAGDGTSCPHFSKTLSAIVSVAGKSKK